MNLSKLFDLQRQLDEHIVMEKGLEGQFLLPQKILALQVELGELANEWRGFKFWKVDPRPSNKVLEEYVDCLHFILSVGLEQGYDDLILDYEDHLGDMDTEDVTYIFLRLMDKVGDYSFYRSDGNYLNIFHYFVKLGELLGFTWEQIEQAYLDKNKVNHSRQASGY